MMRADKGIKRSFSPMRTLAAFALCSIAVACFATSVRAQAQTLVSRESEMPRPLVSRDYDRRYVVGVESFQVERPISQEPAATQQPVSRDRDQFKIIVGRDNFDPGRVVSGERIAGHAPVTVESEQPQAAVSRERYHRGFVGVERRMPARVVSQEPTRK